MTYYSSTGSGYGAPSSMSSPYSSYGGSSYGGGSNGGYYNNIYGGNNYVAPRQHVQYGFMGTSDLNFIKNNNVHVTIDKKDVPLNYNTLLKDKNSSDPSDCNAHRSIQEQLRDKYGYYSDPISWDKNNQTVHTYIAKKYVDI
jgi:hypothetical protein